MKQAIPFITVMCLLAGTNLKAQNEHKLMTSVSLPLYDSIYYWTLDTTTKAWVFNNKEISIVYNAANKITSQLVQNWNGTTWVNSTVDTFRYNANNVDTTDADQAWTGRIWENNYKYTYTYNTADSVISAIEQILNGSGWRNYKKYSYTYDVNNNKTSLLEQQWNGSVWTFGYQYIFIYNSNNLKIKQVDSTGASYNRWLYGYNSNNLLVTDTSQYWTGSTWATDFSYFYSYNTNNLDSSEVMQQWTGSTWVNYERYLYSYDAGNNLIGQKFQNWGGSTWVNFQQYAYTYDASNIMLSEKERQFFNGGNTVILGDSTYWYFHKTAGINEITQKSNLLIYPNPSKDKFTIQMDNGKWIMNNEKAEIEIYNTLGQQIFFQFSIVNFPLSIDLSNQPNGIYFLCLKSAQGVMNGKVIIQR